MNGIYFDVIDLYYLLAIIAVIVVASIVTIRATNRRMQAHHDEILSHLDNALREARMPAQANVDAAHGPHFVRVSCYKLGCGAAQTITVTGNVEDVATSEQFNEKFHALGWRTTRAGQDVCPACVAKEESEAA